MKLIPVESIEEAFQNFIKQTHQKVQKGEKKKRVKKNKSLVSFCLERPTKSLMKSSRKDQQI